jgi:hypothetical protein
MFPPFREDYDEHEAYRVSGRRLNEFGRALNQQPGRSSGGTRGFTSKPAGVVETAPPETQFAWLVVHDQRNEFLSENGMDIPPLGHRNLYTARILAWYS